MFSKRYSDENHLEYVEFHVVDRCNLNCNACSHFSPMVDEDFDHYESFKSDLYQLKKLFSHITKIRLLGGEPFLEQRLDEYVVLARKLYPSSEIEVVTNGLLIPYVSDRILKSISVNNVIVNITLYPPTQIRIDSIMKSLNENNVQFLLSDKVKTFRKKFLPDGTSNPEKAYAECTVGRFCTFVYLGKLYICSGAALVKYYNRVSGTNIVCKDSSIDIYKTTAEEIISFLNQYNDSCRYCGRASEESWSSCIPKREIDVSHWITTGGCVK